MADMNEVMEAASALFGCTCKRCRCDAETFLSGRIDMDTDTQFYVDELASEECVCGEVKNTGMSFCYSCYMALPNHMRRDLYQQLYHGYEQAYDAAVVELGEQGRIADEPQMEMFPNF